MPSTKVEVTNLAARRVLSSVAYPATMAGALAGAVLLQVAGLSLLASAYLVVVLAAGLVTALEIVIPYNKAWRPHRTDVTIDAIFMVAVQLALPQLLGLLVALTLRGYSESLGAPLRYLWPRELPLPVQAGVALLFVELLRYPLHVAAHNTKVLWRLHAVHHSPRKLYWLNVGRFHPVEKTLQYVTDTLPLILLGVGADVIALYFVFYAVNGFYQHSNVDVRYGPLNYLVSGPELHRWHHSVAVAHSNSNYGNNLIVWDLVFGTRVLPHGARVGALGLLNPDYPADFVGQLRAPFGHPEREPVSHAH